MPFLPCRPATLRRRNNPSNWLIAGIGSNLKGDGLVIGITDGSSTNVPHVYQRRPLTNPIGERGCFAQPINSGDLCIGAASNGPNWQTWIELGDTGGFPSSPNRRDQSNIGRPQIQLLFRPVIHGQWQCALAQPQFVAAHERLLDWVFRGSRRIPLRHERQLTICTSTLPPSPDGTYAAYICNTNDFAVQIISTE